MSMDLPDECWELILNRLGGHHQYHLDAISLVCKRFLSISSCLVHSLTISDPRIFLPRYSSISISKFFQRFSQLKRIHISGPFPTHRDLELIMFGIARSGLNNLEELSFLSQYEIPVEVWMELGSNMKKLKTLRLKYCALSERLLVAIANSLPWIQELYIRYPSGPAPTACDKAVMEEMASKLFKEMIKITIPNHASITSKTDSGDRLVSVCFTGYAIRHCSNLHSLSVSHYAVNSLRPSSPSSSSSSFSIENSLSYARALRALEFRKSYLSDALLCSIAEAHLPLMKKLKFDACHNITFSGLSTLLQEYHYSLTEFMFKKSAYLTDQHMNHLSRYLCNVTRINLSGCSNIKHSTFFILARSCPLLVEIKMCNTRLGHENDDVGVNLKKHRHLQYLKLSSNSFLNDETLKKIGYICPNVQMLDLSFCWVNSSHCGLTITEDGIGQILKSCSGIRHFIVNGCKLEMILGTGSEHSKLNIEVLEALVSQINDKGMEMIGIRCPSLLKLKLRNCSKVTTEGVKKVVGKCPKLMEIDLAWCCNVSADVLSWMLKTRPSLRKITSHCPFVNEKKTKLFMRHGCRLYSTRMLLR